MPKGGLSHEYGVLLHDMEADCICGTCLMGDGRLLTVAWKQLDLAFKRITIIRGKAYEISQSELERITSALEKEQEDLPVFDEKVTQSEEDKYFAEIDAAKELHNQARAHMNPDVHTDLEIGRANCDQVQGEHKAQVSIPDSDSSVDKFKTDVEGDAE